MQAKTASHLVLDFLQNGPHPDYRILFAEHRLLHGHRFRTILQIVWTDDPEYRARRIAHCTSEADQICGLYQGVEDFVRTAFAAGFFENLQCQ